MTNCLKGHRSESRRRGHESLISPPLRLMISDGRNCTPHGVNPPSAVLLRRTGRISYIENFWLPCLVANGVRLANAASIVSRLAASKPLAKTGQAKIKPKSGRIKPKKHLKPCASSHTPSAPHCRPLPAIASLPAKKTFQAQAPPKPPNYWANPQKTSPKRPSQTR
jgi:hypothetical protein